MIFGRGRDGFPSLAVVAPDGSVERLTDAEADTDSDAHDEKDYK